MPGSQTDSGRVEKLLTPFSIHRMLWWTVGRSQYRPLASSFHDQAILRCTYPTGSQLPLTELGTEQCLIPPPTLPTGMSRDGSLLSPQDLVLWTLASWPPTTPTTTSAPSNPPVPRLKPAAEPSLSVSDAEEQKQESTKSRIESSSIEDNCEE